MSKNILIFVVGFLLLIAGGYRTYLGNAYNRMLANQNIPMHLHEKQNLKRLALTGDDITSLRWLPRSLTHLQVKSGKYEHLEPLPATLVSLTL